MFLPTDPDPQTALITAIGFSAFAAIVMTGIIFCMVVFYKLFPDDKQKEINDLKKRNKYLQQQVDKYMGL